MVKEDSGIDKQIIAKILTIARKDNKKRQKRWLTKGEEEGYTGRVVAPSGGGPERGANSTGKRFKKVVKSS